MALTNYYYSGQGSLLAAERDAVTGAPKGFVRVGNIPELSLDIEITKFEHKESETGDRATDLVIIKEKKGKFTFKLENLSLENLALGLYGDSSTVVGASVTNESVIAYSGKIVALARPSVSAVTVTSVNGDDAGTWVTLTPYLLNAYKVPVTPNGHYYKVTVAGTTGASEPTWPTNGTTVTDGTVTWKDMGLIIKSATTDYTLNAAAGSFTCLTTGTIVEGETLEVDYTYGGYTNLEAFTNGTPPERYLRFEGLNTVDGSTVVIDLFRAAFDPLTNFGLINEELGSVDLAGNLLLDPFIVSGSKYFRERIIAAA